MVATYISALERGPEGFNAVRVNLSPDVLGNRVVHALAPVASQFPVSRRAVRVDRRSPADVRFDESVYVFRRGAVNRLHLDLALSGPCPDNDLLS